MAVSKTSKGTKITDLEKKKIIADYILGNSMHFLSRKHKRSVSTIKRIIDEQKTEHTEQFANAVEQVKSDNSKAILASISDNKTLEIIERYRDIILDKNYIDLQIHNKAKLQFFTNTIGMCWDKQLKLKSIEENVDALENGIKIKIVNDAPND